MTFEESLSSSGRRLFGVGLAVVLGAAVTGFFAGTRQNHPPPVAVPHGSRAAASGEVLPGETYLERRARRHGPSSKVTSSLDRFRSGGPKIGDPVTITPDALSHDEAGTETGMGGSSPDATLSPLAVRATRAAKRCDS